MATVKAIAEVADDDMILDIGPQTAAQFAELLKTSKTILWNGPVGVFEFDQFGEGTRTLANAIADSAAFSIAGGGDTLAAIDKYGIAERISYISTGGGAFLEVRRGQGPAGRGNPGAARQGLTQTGKPFAVLGVTPLRTTKKEVPHAFRNLATPDVLPGPGRL